MNIDFTTRDWLTQYLPSHKKEKKFPHFIVKFSAEFKIQKKK